MDLPGRRVNADDSLSEVAAYAHSSQRQGRSSREYGDMAISMMHEYREVPLELQSGLFLSWRFCKFLFQRSHLSLGSEHV
jgi:hypothetical protein